jgi:hypothetical protein
VATILAGPITNPATQHQYYLFNTTTSAGGLTWVDAEDNAVALKGHLATIRNADENEFVRANVLRFDGADRRAFIGLNDAAVTNTYVWSSGEAVVYTHWNSGEPNHAGGTEHYAEMLGVSGLWNDVNLTGYGGAEWAIAEVYASPYCLADFNGDGDIGTDADIEAFFACLGGSCCPTCGSADFNGDGDIGTDADIESFFRVLAGGAC